MQLRKLKLSSLKGVQSLRRADMSRKVFCIFVLLSACIQLVGCATLMTGAVAGAGGVVWVKGRLSEELDVNVSTVYEASIEALRELELPVLESEKDKLTARIRSEFSDGTKVWIDIDSRTETSAKIVIRVGILGDEEKSRRLLDAVHRHL